MSGGGARGMRSRALNVRGEAGRKGGPDDENGRQGRVGLVAARATLLGAGEGDRTDDPSLKTRPPARSPSFPAEGATNIYTH